MNRDDESAGGKAPRRDAEDRTPDNIDAPQAALNRMREAAAARGEIRRAAPRPGSQKAKKGIRDTRGFSQFHATGRDPLGLGKVVGRLVAERGWTSPVAVGSVMAEWATLVGPEISAHCTPESFTGTTLHVRCDSTAWATQLRLLSMSLLEKFRVELGDGVVTSIQVLGPSAPSWRKGGRSVNGRGPRDTYG
jgi:predicted nucleic acid-binding Zn ribbon protein